MDVGFLSHAYRLPARVVTSAELEASLGLGPGVIHRLTGIERRRYVSETDSLPGLAVDACQEALAKSGLAPSEVDAMRAISQPTESSCQPADDMRRSEEAMH